MSVELLWNQDNVGTEISQPLNHGTVSGNATTSGLISYLEHGGINPLKLCRFYITSGNASEILGWGDDGTGGFQLNMNAINNFPADSWITLTSSLGSTPDNAITLDDAMNLINDGIIQAGVNPNIRFKTRLSIPASGVTVGIKTFEQKLKYTSTS